MAISLLVCLTIVIGSTIGCRQRDYGNGGTVCVCDTNYCDTYKKVTPLSSGKYEMYTSSLAGDRFKRSSGEFRDSASNATNSTLVIKPDIEHQIMFGFGGAFTDAAGINILSLSNETGQKLMESYFAEHGIEYSMGRVPIGGTDFSTRGYTYDDVEDDVDLKFFSLQIEDYQYKIPLIKMAQKLSKKKLKLFATAWTAPSWMKTNHRLSGIGFLNISMFNDWGNYHIRFLDCYAAHDIEFWGLTTGNEPANGFNAFIQINDMGWDPLTHAQWIAESLGPKIRSHSAYKHLKIIIVDDQRVYFPWVTRAIYSNEIAKSYVDGAGVHYYLDKYVDAEVLSITHFDCPEKFILATEGCEGSLAIKAVILGSWDRAENYLTSMIDDINNWSTGWVDWNIALNTEGGPTYVENFVDSPIIVNKTSDEFYKQPMYYAIGHFSKFVPADSVRVESHGLESDLKSVVFKRPDGGTVAQVLNPTDSDKVITLRDCNSSDIVVTIEKRSMNSILYW